MEEVTQEEIELTTPSLDSPPQDDSLSSPFNLLELFSGIGGMRYSLPPKIHPHKILSYEIAPAALQVYSCNFPTTPNSNLRKKMVEHITPEDVDGFGPLWTMSPPCQPFSKTLGAKHLDMTDARCAGLLHVIDLLEKVKVPPKWILLENVKGFYTSKMYLKLKSSLDGLGYTYKNYLLSPHQLGIPNMRTRFYLLCEHSDRFKDFCNKLVDTFPFPRECSPLPLSHFVSAEENDNEQLAFPEKFLGEKWFADIPKVTEKDTLTHCFTAGYARKFHAATGSLLKFERDGEVRYRRFSPGELLKLFGFPEEMKFPEELSYRLRWKVVGNSLSVFVVKELMKELLGSLLEEK